MALPCVARMTAGRDSLSHLDAEARAAMVNVAAKPVSQRTAVAECFVRINANLEAAIRENAIAKGNLLDTARLAGIAAAKRTDELIPLCHSLPLDHVEVDATLEAGRVRIVARASAHARTGVEMEALTAAAVAALTVIDMGKAVDRAMCIDSLRVLEKHGGTRGSYVADAGTSR